MDEEQNPSRWCILQYDALTGAVGKAKVLRYADVPGMPLHDHGTARVSHPTFSGDGKLLAVCSRAALFVVDTAMCTMSLVLPFGEEREIPHEMDWGLTCWSWDHTVIAALGMLMHLRDDRMIELGPPAQLHDIAFDRTCRVLGMTQFTRNDDSGLEVPAAVLTDVASGQPLFKVDNHAFIGFFSLHGHALLMLQSEPQPVVQVWDVEKAVCLRSFASGFRGSPFPHRWLTGAVVQSVLDDTFLVEASAFMSDGHKPTFWSAKSGAAVWQYRVAETCCLSADETHLAVGFLMPPGHGEVWWDMHAYLVRL